MSNKLYFYIFRFNQTLFAKGIFKARVGVSKILFWWYYKRVPKHFHSWPFFQSVKILISNYIHRDEWASRSDKMLGDVIRENTKLVTKINTIELKKVLDESQVDFINTTFGLNLPKATSN